MIEMGPFIVQDLISVKYRLPKLYRSLSELAHRPSNDDAGRTVRVSSPERDDTFLSKACASSSSRDDADHTSSIVSRRGRYVPGPRLAHRPLRETMLDHQITVPC